MKTVPTVRLADMTDAPVLRPSPKEQQAAERLRAGSQGAAQHAHKCSTCHDALAFMTDRGGPVDPHNALRTIELAAENAGLHTIGVHTLQRSGAVAWCGRIS
jgi:mono/diheme cytochrome c family protein